MQDPQSYETFKSHALKDNNEFVPRMIADMSWKKKEKILDYGCGAGSTGANLILPQVELFDSKLYSVDVSKIMLEHAKREYSNPRINYALGDILKPNFPFQNIQFDKIFTIYVFHFIKDFTNVLRRFFLNLKDGGQGGFSLIAGSCFFESLPVFGESEKWKNCMKGYSKFLPDWLKKGENAENLFGTCLKEVGFEIVKISAEKKKYSYENLDTLVEFYFSLNPCIRTIPVEEHSDFKSDLRKFLIQRWNVPNDSKSVTISYHTLYLVVRKPERR